MQNLEELKSVRAVLCRIVSSSASSSGSRAFVIRRSERDARHTHHSLFPLGFSLKTARWYFS